MTGAGRRTFAPGEVLTASNVMSYLQDQAVMNFAGTAARGSAIGTAVSEGMVSYLADTNSIEVYKTSGTAIAGWENNTAVQSPNVVINGSFDIWQRGTSFSNPANAAYTADRWQVRHDGTGATRTVSQQAFTPGTAPVAGYEGSYFYRYAVSNAGSGNTYQDFRTLIEDVRTFANSNTTLSFWAKADSARTVTLIQRVEYGASADQFTIGSVSLTTSWARYVVPYAVPSVAGKTIGATSSTHIIFRPAAATTQTVDVWGVQWEKGQTATPFRRNANSIQGELAACQRYYQKSYNVEHAPGTNTDAGLVQFAGSTNGGGNTVCPITFRVQMRAQPAMAFYTQTGTANMWDYERSGAVGVTTANASGVGTSGLRVYVGLGVGFVSSAQYGHWVANAEL